MELQKSKTDFTLLAIYVEDYKCFKDFTIPFTNDYKINISKNTKEKLTFDFSIEFVEKSINIFSDYVDNVTGFIGENGAGKSTVARVLRVIASNQRVLNCVVILVFILDGKILIRRYKEEMLDTKPNIKIVDKSEKKLPINFDKVNEFYDVFQATNTKLVFYSNLFSYSDEKVLNTTGHHTTSDLVNASVDYAFRDSLTYNKTKDLISDLTSTIERDLFNITKPYYSNMLKKMISFLIFVNKRPQEKLKKSLAEIIRVPAKIYLNFDAFEIIFLIKKQYKLNDEFQTNLNGLFQNESNSFIDFFNLNYLVAFVFSKNFENNMDVYKRSTFIKFLTEIKKDDNISLIIEKFHQLLGDNKIFKLIIDEHNKIQKFYDMQTIDETQTLGVKSYSLYINENSFKFLELLDTLQKTIKVGFIKFNWAAYLSSGEEAILNQFSEYYFRFEKFRNSNCIFLIDEGELYLHPKWQRKYLFSMLVFLKHMLPEDKFKSIIITSHSPFIVSDMPRNNLILLTRDEGGIIVNRDCLIKTFGANIHELFTDAFFMEGGLMGEFAKKKISETIQILEEYKNYRFNFDASKPNIDFYEIKNIISIIGEPILRNKLKEYYEECVGVSWDESLIEKKKRLQKELRVINAEIRRV